MPYEYLPREANGLNTMRLCIQESSEMVPAISSTDNKLDNMMPPRKANASCLPITAMVTKAIRLRNANTVPPHSRCDAPRESEVTEPDVRLPKRSS